jgi:hypothetical protein
MIKIFKEWLRGIIREEIEKLGLSLQREHSHAVAALKNTENEISRSLRNEFEAFEAPIKATVEAEYAAFVADLRAAREHIGNGEPSRCVASAEQVAADHALKRTK